MDRKITKFEDCVPKKDGCTIVRRIGWIATPKKKLSVDSEEPKKNFERRMVAHINNFLKKKRG